MKLTGLSVIIFSLAGILFAQETDTPYSDNSSGDAPIMNVDKLAETYRISVDSVYVLRESYSLGYGEISHALAMAEKSGKSAEDILRMKTEEKKGWGLIAEEQGLKPGEAYIKKDLPEQKAGTGMEQDNRRVKMEKAMVKAERKNNRRHGKK